ncbi:MAG: PTS IIA-like nitrogen regulatory protein PtsN [Rhizobiaceae bacterium]|nr:PTS IIA-like nitrogen regulatory protein PtsN [Rhizobiaceae bacterium]MBL4696686.1 PTS IIA-like nitrogen regulatory protein PtsN [Rhizobiaceae bacterium]
MDLGDLVSPEHIVASLKSGSKKQVLQELAELAADVTGVPERRIFDILLERERLGSTGVGNGIAIPHGTLPELDQIFSLYVRLENSVDFDAVDGEDVDIIFLLLAPEGAGAEHLKALARIARVLRDENTCEKLRKSSEISAIHTILCAPQASKTM